MIRAGREGEVCVIRLDRPDRRNALTWEGLRDLRATLAAADAPVCYLHGSGPGFCAGADLETVEALTPETAREFAREGQRTAAAIADYDGAVVAGIDGAARGGGVELALACDLRVATPGATLAESGVELGLFGAWGGTHRLPRIVGPSVAADMALTGRVLDADAAREVGLVSRVTDDPRAVAERVAAQDERTVRELTGLVGAGTDGSASSGQAAARRHQEARERTAFAALVAGRDDRNR
jgi:enoyl-CoA hydratase/carnithine racemase